MIKNVWTFLISLRLTIVLLILLSGVCVIGTVIPQNEPEQTYLRLYAQSTYALMKTAGLVDMYHAWWFVCLLGAFTANLVACSLNRLPRILKLIARTDPVLDDARLQTLPLVKKFSLKRWSPEDASGAADALGRFLARPATVTSGDTVHFFSEKGRWAPASFYLTHIGMVIIIAGVLAGTLGFQGYMNLPEGESSSVIFDKKTREQRPLDFTLRCEKFEVTYYEKANTPKDYKSTLTVIEQGTAVLTKTIEVNDPLIYRGIYFYQSSYGIAPGAAGEVALRISPRGSSQGREYRAAVNRRFQIEGTQDAAEIETILPDFATDGKGGFFSRSEEPRNPAARVTIYPGGKEPYKIWVFAQFPDFHRKPDEQYTVSFVQYYPRYYTGLQVTRDPGVWIVWVGCSVLILGILLALFSSHRRIWLRVEKHDKYYTAVLGGIGTKNTAGFAAEFNRLYEHLKTIGK
jgi:cytochrome c biogenesis protein